MYRYAVRHSKHATIKMTQQFKNLNLILCCRFFNIFPVPPTQVLHHRQGQPVRRQAGSFGSCDFQC